METVQSAPACSNPNCQVASSKVCAEGHSPLQSCPHWGGGDVDHSLNDEQAFEVPSDTIDSEYIKVDGGEALTQSEAQALLRWRPAFQVAVLGEQSSGKTTLICALHDRFLRGPFAGVSFVGSRTLVGLERRSHHSRIESGNSSADTQRTSIKDGLGYLHLAVAITGEPARRVDFLISDRAGEIYRRIKDNVSEATSLEEVVNAHRVVLLLDGGKIAKKETRPSALQGVRQLLRSLIDGGALSKGANVQIVITKIDLINALPDRPAVLEQVGQFMQRLASTFAASLNSLTYWEVASRPEGGALEPAFGLDKLLVEWMSPIRSEAGFDISKLIPLSEFDRLLFHTDLD